MRYLIERASSDMRSLAVPTDFKPLDAELRGKDPVFHIEIESLDELMRLMDHEFSQSPEQLVGKYPHWRMYGGLIVTRENDTDEARITIYDCLE